MEQIKSFLMELGKKLGQGALALLRTGAKTGVELVGSVAGKAASCAKEKTGELVRSAGNKVKSTAKEHRQGLLLFAAAVSGVALIASLIGYAMGREK